jgi:hypothetical protein
MDAREMECKKERLFENTFIAVNVKTKEILSINVTGEHIHDSKMLPEFVDSIITSDSMTTTIGKPFGDGTYESNEIFRYLADNGILPCIKVRKNARVRWMEKRTHF